MIKKIEISKPPVVHKVTLTFDAEEVSWLDKCGEEQKGLKLDSNDSTHLILLLKNIEKGDDADCLCIMEELRGKFVDSQYNFYNLETKENSDA